MSAAKRVARAAETVRARWERQVSTDPQTEAAQALEDTGQLLDPEVAAELVAFRKARELAAEVAKYGAFPMPVGPKPQPLALSEAQIDALVAAGDRVVNDAVHKDLCMCDAWPESCVSTGNYFMGAWDVSGLETALPAVLGLWESMRGGELAALKARVAELEAERHETNEAPDDAVQELRARQSCPCPPENPPAPHQVGCFFDGVPVSPPSERPVDGPSPLFPTVASLREVSSREEPHDLPEGCRLTAEQVERLGNPFLGGGA